MCTQWLSTAKKWKAVNTKDGVGERERDTERRKTLRREMRREYTSEEI